MIPPLILLPLLLHSYTIPSDLPPPPCTKREYRVGVAACVLIDRKELSPGYDPAKAEKECQRAVECDVWLGVWEEE